MTKLVEENSLSIRPVYAFFTLAPHFEISVGGLPLGEIVREGMG
jgi:hypothetical protein